MNHIHRLQQTIVDRDNELAEIRAHILAFKAHLQSEKFIGTEADGSRKDWIATSDVFNFLGEI